MLKMTTDAIGKYDSWLDGDVAASLCDWRGTDLPCVVLDTVTPRLQFPAGILNPAPARDFDVAERYGTAVDSSSSSRSSGGFGTEVVGEPCSTGSGE